jgi:DNA-binding NtrC family response regulator
MELRPSDKPLVLLVDSTGEVCNPLKGTLRSAGYSATCARCGDPAIEALEAEPYHVVVLSPCAAGEEGLKLLRASHERSRTPEFVVVSQDDHASAAVQAMHLGAMDYLTMPVEPMSFLASMSRAVDRATTRHETARLRLLLRTGTREGIVGRSEAIEQVFDLLERAAPTSVTVLVTGETGTGKELVARAIHDLSPRRAKRFVPVSCAAVPDHLMESSFFGYVRGAFTGAASSRPGLFEEAEGGTIFLDEVECLKPELQAKLLRVLQERTIQRVGGRHDVPVEFRAVAATNANLELAVKSGSFREDLFYRLNVFPIHIPPLRERPGDIPILATHFRDAFAEDTHVDPLPIPDCCMEWMLEYPWPGNVRELRHVVERALLLSVGEPEVKCSALSHLVGRRSNPSWGRALAEEWSFERLQREYASAVLRKTGGHKASAARILGIDRKTLSRKLRRWKASCGTDCTCGDGPENRA